MSTVIQPGYYALLDSTDNLKPITDLEYTPNQITLFLPPTKEVVVPDVNDIYPDGDTSQDKQMSELEAFIKALYRSGAKMTGTAAAFDLTDKISTNGADEDFEDFETVDFMGLTGALEKFQTLIDGTQIKVTAFKPGETRPNIVNLAKKDNTKMLNMIQHLGLQGILLYLFADEGIDMATFQAEVKSWIPLQTEREDYVYHTLIPKLRQLNEPELDQTEIDGLIV